MFFHVFQIFCQDSTIVNDYFQFFLDATIGTTFFQLFFTIAIIGANDDRRQSFGQV